MVVRNLVVLVVRLGQAFHSMDEYSGDEQDLILTSNVGGLGKVFMFSMRPRAFSPDAPVSS